MAKAKRAKPSGPLSRLHSDMLQVLLDDFDANGRTSSDLENGYVGPSMPGFQSEFIINRSVFRVDFDLALKDLEEWDLVDTGPKEAYDNEPGSMLFIVAIFSKREYLFLKEAGYKEARRAPPAHQKAAPIPHVNITGGHFYQSPIGIGGVVSQQINFDVSNAADTIEYLADLLAKAGAPADQATKKDISTLVEAANAGDLAKAKPIFHRVFGAIEGPIKELAYGVLTAIITNQMGLS